MILKEVFVKFFFAVSLIAISFSTQAQNVKKIYVATKGDDAAKGTRTQPVSSIEKGLILVSGIKSSGFSGAVELIVLEGTYYLKNTILIDQKLSGTKTAPFTIRAAENQKVVLSGGVLLKNLKWTKSANGIWSAKIVNQSAIENLFAYGQKMISARYPNFNKAIYPLNGFAKDAIDPERVKNWKDPAGGYLHTLHIGKWGGFHFQILGKDANGNLELTGGHQNNRPSPMHESFRFVENIFEELDDTNEWYFDKKQSVLYFKPAADVNPNKLKFETTRLENLITIQGEKGRPVKFVHIKGFHFVHTAPTFMKTSEPLLRSDWMIYRQGAVKFEDAEDCEVSHSDFYNLGGNAVFISNYNRNVKVTDNLIEEIGASAVSFVGSPDAVRSPIFRYELFVPENEMDTLRGPKSDDYPKNCEVSNNLIRHIGLVEKQVAGVQISMAESINVFHNTIYNVPRAGINVSEGTWGGHDIAFNDVFNTVLETSDHGAFNSWGRDRFWLSNRSVMDDLTSRRPNWILLDAINTTKIRNNRFRCDHGWDIDLDDGSSNYEIYNNLCLSGGIKLREGFYRKVYNNLMLNNGFHPHVWFKDSHDVFRNNIVMTSHADISVSYWGDTVDYNYYIKEDHLKIDQSKGVEKNSTFINPVFRDSKKGDFTIIKGLPEGFDNIDMQNFGVTSARLKELAESPEIPELVFNKTETLGKEKVETEYKGAVIRSIRSLGEQSAAGLPTMEGARIVSFKENSLLSYGGFKVNDVIVACENEEVKNINDLENLLKKYSYYHSIRFQIYRNQVKQELVLNL